MTENTYKDKNLKISNEKSERNYLFDNIKAVLIFSVVLAHYYRASASFAMPTFGGMVYTISFAYIMQGFLFVSGYFSRNLEKCRSTAFQSFLFPYLVLMPVMYSIRYLLFGKAHFDLTLPTMALWYLLTLFVYRYFLKDLVKIKNILPVSIVVSLAAGYISVLDSTLSLGRTFSFLPFFLIGYYFKEDWIGKIRKVPKTASCILLAVLLGLTVYAAFHGIYPVEALYMKSSYESTGLTNWEGTVLRVVISLLSWLWIFLFVNLLPQYRTFLTRIGQSTMAIYILHIVVRYLIKSWGGYFGQDVLSYLVLTVTAVASVWAFSRPLTVRAYHFVLDTLYRWMVTNPRILIRQIL